MLGVVADEPHVAAPVPPPAGVGVPAGPSEPARVLGVRYLVVPDDVPAVDRHAPAMRQVRHELRRGPVLSHRVATPAGPALVLDADPVQVPPAVARVPGDVADRD